VRLHKNRFFPILLEHIGDNGLERFGRHPDGEMNAAVISPKYRESKPQQDDPLRVLAKQYDSWQKNHDIKGEMIFCDIDHLQVVDGCVMCGDKTIRIMIETYIGRIPLLIMDAVKKKNLSIYNGPIGLLLSHKLNLALLSEYRNSDLFTPDEKEAIREYIPWTRKIVSGFTTYGSKRIKLEEFIISNRERLVMKSGTGYGGYEVFAGFSTPPARWKQQMEQAVLKRDWVVQEYVPSFSYLYQAGEQGCTGYHATWGFFISGSRYAGGFVRMLPEKGNRGIINYHQGAEESIILEVEE
jgi:hypothetical protein